MKFDMKDVCGLVGIRFSAVVTALQMLPYTRSKLNFPMETSCQIPLIELLYIRCERSFQNLNEL
jgi:hypothetical protein